MIAAPRLEEAVEFAENPEPRCPCVLLLDTSGSEQDMLGAIQDAGSQFISRIIRKGDEALVMSFDSNVDLL